MTLFNLLPMRLTNELLYVYPAALVFDQDLLLYNLLLITLLYRYRRYIPVLEKASSSKVG